MLSATLKSGLSDYEIGRKIRALRLKKKMGLVELGRHTGLSPALLSKIERGRLFPTLPTLLRIALVFGVGLEFFFVGAREKPLLAVVRKAERVQLPDQPGARDISYRFESLDYPATERRFNSYFADFLPVPAEKVRVHLHPGVEFIYVLQGALGGGDDVALAERVPPVAIRDSVNRRSRWAFYAALGRFPDIEFGASRFAPLSTPTPRRSTSSPPSHPPTAPNSSATTSIVNNPLVVAR
jgi:transcriptional regulator with XRE-family HTH domain